MVMMLTGCYRPSEWSSFLGYLKTLTGCMHVRGHNFTYTIHHFYLSIQYHFFLNLLNYVLFDSIDDKP